jgi:hypothetical protein
LPTLSSFGVPEPLAIPAAFFSSTAAGRLGYKAEAAVRRIPNRRGANRATGSEF